MMVLLSVGYSLTCLTIFILITIYLPCQLHIGTRSKWLHSVFIVGEGLYVICLDGSMEDGPHLSFLSHVNCHKVVMQYWMVNVKKIPLVERLCFCDSREAETTNVAPFMETSIRFILSLISRYPGCLDSAYAQMLLINEVSFFYSARS